MAPGHTAQKRLTLQGLPLCPGAGDSSVLPVSGLSRAYPPGSRTMRKHARPAGTRGTATSELAAGHSPGQLGAPRVGATTPWGDLLLRVGAHTSMSHPLSGHRQTRQSTGTGAGRPPLSSPHARQTSLPALSDMGRDSSLGSHGFAAPDLGSDPDGHKPQRLSTRPGSCPWGWAWAVHSTSGPQETPAPWPRWAGTSRAFPCPPLPPCSFRWVSASLSRLISYSQRPAV